MNCCFYWKAATTSTAGKKSNVDLEVFYVPVLCWCFNAGHLSKVNYRTSIRTSETLVMDNCFFLQRWKVFFQARWRKKCFACFCSTSFCWDSFRQHQRFNFSKIQKRYDQSTGSEWPGFEPRTLTSLLVVAANTLTFLFCRDKWKVYLPISQNLMTLSRARKSILRPSFYVRCVQFFASYFFGCCKTAKCAVIRKTKDVLQTLDKQAFRESHCLPEFLCPE